jgi:hypothetical protein
MPIYATEQAVDQSIAQIQNYTPDNNPPLSSGLLKDSEYLEQLNRGEINEAFLVRYTKTEEVMHAIGLVQTALKILIPKFASYSLISGFSQTGTLDSNTKSLIQAFKQEMTFLEDDDQLDSKTIHQIDYELNKIGWYDMQFEAARIVHDYSEWVGEEISEASVIYNAQNPPPTPSVIYTVTIYRAPATGEENKLIETFTPPSLTPVFVELPYNHLIYVESKSGDGNWLLIHFEKDGKRFKGFVEKQYVWQCWGKVDGLKRMPMPDPEAEIYKVPSGKYAYGLIKEKYHDGDLSDITEDEVKFNINILLFANNRTVRDPARGIYLDIADGDDDLDTIIDQIEDINEINFENFIAELASQNALFQWDFNKDSEGDYPLRLVADKYIWLPGKGYMETLYNYINRRDSYFFEIYEDLRKTIKDYWPRGFGINLEGNIGIKFGIPKGHGGVYFHMYRVATENLNDVKIKIVKRFEIGIGAEIGIGIGFFAGSGKANKSGSTSPGFGGEIGGQLTGDQTITILEVFEFDIVDLDTFKQANCKDLALIALIDAMIGYQGPPNLMTAVKLITAAVGYNIDPNRYLTKLKLTWNRNSSITLVGEAGLRFGDEDYADVFTNPSSHTEPSGKIKHKKGNPYSLGNFFGLLNARAGISAGASIGFGLEFTPQYNPVNCIDEVTGWRVPEKVQISVFPSASYFANASVDLFKWYDEDFFEIDFQYEFHLIFELDISPANIIELLKPQSIIDNFKLKYVKFVRASGEFDIFLGPGRETSITFDIDQTMGFVDAIGDIADRIYQPLVTVERESGKVKNLESIKASIKSLTAIINQVQIQKRIDTGYQSKKLKEVLHKQDNARLLLPKEYRQFGFRFNHYLDLSVEFAGSDLEKLIIDFIEFMVQHIPSITQLSASKCIALMIELFEGIRRENLSHMADTLEKYIRAFLDYIRKNSPVKLNIHSHCLVGLQGATGLDIRIGPAHFAADINGHVGITTDYQIISNNELDGFIREFAKKRLDAAGLNSQEIDMTEFFRSFLRELRVQLFPPGEKDFELSQNILTPDPESKKVD